MSRIIKETIVFQSACLNKAIYIPRHRILKLTYSNQARYIYFKVGSHIWEGLRSAKSAGKFTNKFLKPYYEFHRQDK